MHHVAMGMTEDRADIVELIHRYTVATDRREFAAVADLFTEDGQATYSGVRLAPGRAAIVAHLQPLAGFPVSQHVVGTLSVTLDGDAGDGHVVHGRAPGAAGRYRPRGGAPRAQLRRPGGPHARRLALRRARPPGAVELGRADGVARARAHSSSLTASPSRRTASTRSSGASMENERRMSRS